MTQIKYTNVGALIERLYEREELLVGAGLGAFSAALRFVEEVSESDADLEAHRGFLASSKKSSVVYDKEFDEELDRLRDEADSRYEASGDVSDLELTKLSRRIGWLRKQESLAFMESLNRFSREMDQSWTSEVATFAGLVNDDEFRTICVRQLTDLEKFGFQRATSSRRNIVFRRSLDDGLSLSWNVDVGDLSKPVGSPFLVEQAGEVVTPGPLCSMWLGLPAGKSGDPEIRVMFDALFPIREQPLGTSLYHTFRTPQELQAILRVHQIMYEVVLEDLDAAVLQDLRTFQP